VELRASVLESRVIFDHLLHCHSHLRHIAGRRFCNKQFCKSHTSALTNNHIIIIINNINIIIIIIIIISVNIQYRTDSLVLDI
jgi:hypothetical protein